MSSSRFLVTLTVYPVFVLSVVARAHALALRAHMPIPLPLLSAARTSAPHAPQLPLPSLGSACVTVLPAANTRMPITTENQKQSQICPRSRFWPHKVCFGRGRKQIRNWFLLFVVPCDKAWAGNLDANGNRSGIGSCFRPNDKERPKDRQKRFGPPAARSTACTTPVRMSVRLPI